MASEMRARSLASSLPTKQPDDRPYRAADAMSALGDKQTRGPKYGMSACPPTAPFSPTRAIAKSSLVVDGNRLSNSSAATRDELKSNANGLVQRRSTSVDVRFIPNR